MIYKIEIHGTKEGKFFDGLMKTHEIASVCSEEEATRAAQAYGECLARQETERSGGSVRYSVFKVWKVVAVGDERSLDEVKT